ncbi:MAG: carboxypeptidase regulatory-like domain-containing protein [Acidobacteria bacterium]|nr:carboxypeptidase regulatory-like domain-containing protein [Acidobacteriota bacterium]
MKTLLILGTIVLLLSFPTAVMAQQTASVTGTVTDATGAVLPGVDVTATHNNIGIATARITNESGSYTVPALQPGPYTIVASLPGFSDSTIQVNLTPNQTYRFNFKLEVGTVATTVEVISDSDALLATTNASVGDALPEIEVFNLPLATRDVFDLLDTTAGLVRSQDGDATNFAGTRVSAVNTTRDGIVVSDGRYLDWNGAYAATYSSPDLVEEVQVSVGTVDAEAGRGSSQVRLQTRSGTNQYHGALFWTTNNSALNANNWFDNLRGRDKDYTNRNQFGGRIGGPIIRNKAFFFVLIDNQRYLTRNNVTGNVWTAAARQGIFRYWPGVENRNFLQGPGRRSVDALGNPVRPDGATGGLQSMNLFSDVRDPFRTGISNHSYIQETLRRMPLPNDFTVGDGLNTAGIAWTRRQSGIDNAAGTSQNTNRDQLNLRLDYQVTTGNKVSFILNREHNFNDDSQPTWPGGLKGVSTRDPRVYSALWTSTISPTVLNEFRFGFRASSWHGRPPFSDGCCFGDDPGPFGKTKLAEETLAYFSKSNGYPYLPNLNTLGGNKWLTTPTGTTSRSQISPLWQFSDTFSWVAGKHAFKVGWEGFWADSDGWNSGGLWPRVDLGSGNFRPDIQGRFPGLQNADATRAENILNDLAGSVSRLQQSYIVNDPKRGFDDILDTVRQNLNFHQDDWSAFFKDTWNATGNLTLNYGVRWDVYGVPYEGKGLNTAPKDGNIFGISGPGGQLTEILTVGKFSLNPDIGLYDKDWNNIAPSFGLSYRVPWAGRTTVVRGGYGISYNGAPTFLQFDFGAGRNPGKAFDGDATPSVYTALPGSTNASAAEVQFPLPLPIEPFGTIPLTDRRVNLFAYAHDRRTPYIQNFNLSIETELARNTNFSVAWIGTKGTSLWGGRELNEPEIFSNGILDAFITTREGGNAPLFDQMFKGINFGTGTCRVVNGTTCTGSQALRQYSRTRNFFANGESAGFAEFINQTNALTGQYGGFLRRNSFAENFIVVNPQFNQVNLYDNNDNSTYHAFQTQVTKRFSSGYSGQFSYTWSKAIGNSATSTFRAREDQSFWTRDPRNRSLQKGLPTFHRTHQFVAHGIWELPFGPSRLLASNAPNWVHRLVERWQFSSIFNWSSGQPIPLLTGGGAFGSGGIETLAAEQVLNTPDLVAGMDAFPKSAGKVNVGDGVITYMDGFRRVAEPVNEYYGNNPDRLERFDNLWQIVDEAGNVVLRNPKPGTTGNLSNNWLQGPGNLRLDVAMSKAVRVREGTTLTLRMDAVNVLNTPQWGSPNLNINNANFGRITTASGVRTFTFNARVDF